MRIGQVIGRVTLNRAVHGFVGARLPILEPLPFEALANPAAPRPRRSEEVVAYDDLGAGTGLLVGFSEGREAANPFGEDPIAVDAYVACLLDQVDIVLPRR